MKNYFLNKIFVLVKLLIGFLFALPILIFRPLIIVRLSYIESTKFGGMIDGPNVYFDKNCLLNINKKKTFDLIFFDNKKFCNYALKKIWLRKKKIFEYNPIFLLIFRFFQFFNINSHFFIIPSYPVPVERFFVNLSKEDTNTWGWMFSDQVQFSEKEKKEGLEILKKFDINLNDKWICIHNRDSSYLNKKLNETERETAHTHRNFSIHSLIYAAEYFANSGYFVFRMGSFAKEHLISKNNRIIDYAFSPNKSEFADLYLLANCYAYFGSSAGLATLPIIKRKPTCYINFSPFILHFLTNHNTLPTIFKQVRSTKTGQILSFKEIFENNLFRLANYKLITEKGYELIDNTSDEIKNLSVEVCQYLSGEHNYTMEEKEQQKVFYDLILKYIDKKYLGKYRPAIGKYFIKKNLHLLT